MHRLDGFRGSAVFKDWFMASWQNTPSDFLFKVYMSSVATDWQLCINNHKIDKIKIENLINNNSL